MKKINEKEYRELLGNRGRRGEGKFIIESIMELKVGEILFVSKDEWKLKTNLSAYIGSYRNRHGIKVETTKVEGGWVIKRL